MNLHETVTDKKSKIRKEILGMSALLQASTSVASHPSTEE
jgi:hypothetical protein